jgi:hypothetical protein
MEGMKRIRVLFCSIDPIIAQKFYIKILVVPDLLEVQPFLIQAAWESQVALFLPE